MQYWQDETERQALTIIELKVRKPHLKLQSKIKKLEEEAISQRQFYKEVIENQPKENDVGDSTNIVQPEEERVKKPDESPQQQEDQNSSEILFIKNESGQSTVKSATVHKLVERLLNPMVHGKGYV